MAYYTLLHTSLTLPLTTHTHTYRGQESPSPHSMKDKVKLEKGLGSSDLLSPKEALMAASDLGASKLPDDSSDSISSLPSSPGADDSIQDPDEFTKLSVYSPTQDSRQFSIPEEIANEAQTDTSLPNVPDGKHFGGLTEAEFAVSSTSEPSYYAAANPASTRGYSYSQSSMSPNSIISPSTAYPGFNPTFTGSEGSAMMMSAGMYNPACMSPTAAYMSPYGTSSKQYAWPSTPNGVNYGAAFGAHDLMSSGYAAASYQPNYSQMTRSNYPTAAYFPSTPMPATTSPTC